MQLSISSESQLVDDIVYAKVLRAEPGQTITLRAETKDINSVTWQSEAVFRASETGIVDPNEQTPISGTYHDQDPMGLVWSMTPQAKDRLPSAFIADKNKPLEIVYSVIVNGEAVETATVQRQFADRDIKRQSINDNGVVGEFFAPDAIGKHPAILLLAGSSGGITSQLAKAQLLASHGYVVFLQAYFRYPGVADELYEQPLEIFQQGLHWLQQQACVDHDRVAVVAVSKGAEGILAAASYLPDLNLRAIVAISPSNVIWQGIGRGKPAVKSSWSLAGTALPFIAYSTRSMLRQVVTAKIVRALKLDKILFSLVRTTLAGAYSKVKHRDKATREATIPVEKITAPLFIITGDDDQLWPASYMSEQIIKRRLQNNVADKDEHYAYPHAGHVFNVPYQPCTVPWMVTPGGKMIINFGGKSRFNAEAQEDGWFRMLGFLSKHLVMRVE